MSVKKPSIALGESVAAGTVEAAARPEARLSTRLDATARRTLVLEAGLEAVRKWEAEHGEFSAEELARADGVLDAGVDRTTF